MMPGLHPDGVTHVLLSDLTQGDAWRIALPHTRDRHLLFWLTRGEGRALLGGARVGLAQDVVCIIPAGAISMIETSARANGRGVLLPASFSAETVGPARIAVSSPETHPAFQYNSRLDALKTWLSESSEFARQPASGPDALRRALFDRLALPRPAAHSMASHAHALGVTPTHLTRVCSSALGRTAAELLTGRTLHAARTALEDTDNPIKDIAAQVGFSSAAYFTRFVQKHTQLTPSALRRVSKAA